MKFKISFNFDKKNLTSINWRPLWVGIIAGIIMSIFMSLMSYLKINPAQIANQSLKKASLFDNIWLKLQAKPNNYKLNRTINLIPNTYAGNFDDQSKAYAVIDFDSGHVLQSKDSTSRLPVASLTKLMTAVVALDLSSPQEVFTVTQNAANAIPTKIGVNAGDKMSLSELLHASLMTSANDAAEAIKDGVNEKYRANIFVEAMNRKAKFLGLNNTHFANPQGFDSPNNYSSIEDLAVLTHYAIENYPLISEIIKKDYAFLPASANHKQFDLYNWNGLLGVYPGVMGVKIGNTDKAGTTNIVLSERNGKKILAVVLGSPDILIRDLFASELLDAGFEQTLNLSPASITSINLQEKYSTWQYWN